MSQHTDTATRKSEFTLPKAKLNLHLRSLNGANIYSKALEHLFFQHGIKVEQSRGKERTDSKSSSNDQDPSRTEI